jgi:hypothetical protein
MPRNELFHFAEACKWLADRLLERPHPIEIIPSSPGIYLKLIGIESLAIRQSADIFATCIS